MECFPLQIYVPVAPVATRPSPTAPSPPQVPGLSGSAIASEMRQAPAVNFVSPSKYHVPGLPKIAANASLGQSVGSEGCTSAPVQGSGGCTAVPLVTSPGDSRPTAANPSVSPGVGGASWQSEPVLNGIIGQAGMTADGVYLYTKDADQTTIPPLPTVSEFQHWRQSVRELVVAASGLGPVAFDWINKVEDKGVDLAQLADSTRPFVRIDLKLKAALSLVLTGNLVNKVRSMTEHLRKQVAMMNGRQVLWIIYHHYSMDK